jgi:hypothetical protein
MMIQLDNQAKTKGVEIDRAGFQLLLVVATVHTTAYDCGDNLDIHG